MKFGNPELLYLFYLLPIIAVLFILFNRQAEKRLGKFAGPALLARLVSGANKRRRLVKFFLSIGVFGFIIAALARPQIGVEPKEVVRVGVDIVVALDTSLSMAAEDVPPNRLAKAKKEIEKLADAFEGNRLGLLLFAGESAVECPLTLDISTFKLFLNSISVNSIPVGGTDISGALANAVASLKGSSAKSKVVLLITDGEDNEGNPLKIAKKASEEGIRIFAVGLGSEKGAPIPMRDENGNLTGYKKDLNGETVFTKQEAKMLKELADVSNGLFLSADGGDFDILPIIESIQSLEKSDITSTKLITYTDRFQWALGIALFLLLIEFII